MVCLSLGVAGVWMGIHEYNRGVWLILVHFLTFMPFYGFGAFYKSILEKYDTLDSIKYFAILLMCSLGIVGVYGHPLKYSLAWCNNFNNGLLMPVISPLIGIAFWLRISKILEPSIGKSKVINTIADNSFVIMIHHLFGVSIIKSFFAVMVCCGLLSISFDWQAYKSNVYYIYLPRDIAQFKIIYVIAGIILPLWLKKIHNKFSSMI